MSADSDPMRARDVLGAMGSSVVSALPVFLVAALALRIEAALDFGPARLGLVVSLYYLAAAVASIPLSKVAGAIGALRTMRMGCLLSAALLVILAGAVHSFAALAIVVTATGAVSSGIQPAANQFLIRRIPSRRYGFAFGIKQAAVPTAVLLGGLAVPGIALTVGWRWAFVTAAAVALGASVLLPRSRTSLSAYRARRQAAPLARQARWTLTVLAAGLGAGVASAGALSTFIVSAAADAGQPETVAGLMAGLGGFLAAGTRAAMGIRADRSRGEQLNIASAMLMAATAGYACLALVGAGVTVLLIPGVVLTFVAGWGWNGLFSLAIATRYPTQAAEATGITSVGARLGGVVGPGVFGFIVEHSSYAYGWIAAGLTALAAAVILALPEPGWIGTRFRRRARP